VDFRMCAQMSYKGTGGVGFNRGLGGSVTGDLLNDHWWM